MGPKKANLLGVLKNACRDIKSMHVSDFCKVAGLLPQTVRAARHRARKRGEPDPVPFIASNSHAIDLYAAFQWLQHAGRYGSLFRRYEHFKEVQDDCTAVVRGFRPLRST